MCRARVLVPEATHVPPPLNTDDLTWVLRSYETAPPSRLGPVSRTMTRALWKPQGGLLFLMSEILL